MESDTMPKTIRRAEPLKLNDRAEVHTLTIDDPRLDHLRPNPDLVDMYVSRQMKNGQTDIEYLMKCWRKRENILMVGETQGGKTMLISVLAVLIGEEMGLGKPVPVFTLSASNGITDFDLFGQSTAWTDPETGIEHIVWLAGTADLAARVGGLFYVDEANMMPERVTSSLHPMTDWRRSFTNRNKAVKVAEGCFIPETVFNSKDLWIAGTMNPNYRGAGTLNEAFANRFRHLDWNYDEEVERRLIPNAAARTLGDALRAARATGHLHTPVGTSALMRLSDDVLEDGVEMALYCLRSMFTEDERTVFDEIIDSRSFKDLLHDNAEVRPATVGSGDNDSPF